MRLRMRPQRAALPASWAPAAESVSVGIVSKSSPARMSEARRAAMARDAAVGDIDWTAPVPGSTPSRFPAPSGELAVVSLGEPSRPRVVLVPGVTGSKEDFALMLPLIAGAGYFVQSLDLAGQYESYAAGPQPGEPYGYELFVDDLVAFLENGGPAHLLGYSFAGVVAQLVAVRRPELVRSLALLTTPPSSGNVFRAMSWLGPAAPAASPRTAASLMLWGIVGNLNRVPPGRHAFVRARLDHTSRRSVEEIMGLMMAAPDLREELRELPIPKAVATGAHDLWPLRAYERFASDIDAELLVYQTGHSPCETAPHQLSADLLELYRRS